MKQITILALLFTVAATGATADGSERDYARQIIGEWQGSRHVRAFYADGGFTLDPQPGDRPLGRCTIKKDRLTTVFGDEAKPLVDRIVTITDSEMMIESRGHHYIFKRVKHP